MQPEWLTSTVTAFARSFAPPCSHSTRSFTREMMRLWLLSLSHRSCNATAAGLVAIPVVMKDLAVGNLPGPEGSFYLNPGIAKVNSTFSTAPCWSLGLGSTVSGPKQKKAGLINQTGLFNLIPAATYVPTQLPVQYQRPGEAYLPCSGWERV